MMDGAKNGRFPAIGWQWAMLLAVLLPQLAPLAGLNPADVSHWHSHVYFEDVLFDHHGAHGHGHGHAHSHGPCPDVQWPAVANLLDGTLAGKGLLFLLPHGEATGPFALLFAAWLPPETAVELFYLRPPIDPPRPV